MSANVRDSIAKREAARKPVIVPPKKPKAEPKPEPKLDVTDPTAVTEP